MGIVQLLPGVQKNILLKNYTTFRIGGPAKYFFVAENERDLILAIKVARKLNLPFFILGGGSNLLISDKGFKGLVIKMQNAKCKIQNYNSKFKIFCEAGTPLAKLVSKSSEIGAKGLEWAAGIPGQVGGAIRGNAGAFGKSMKDIVKEVEIYDSNEGKIKKLKNKDCHFDYRNSIFKENKNLVILSAELKLKKGKKSEIQKKMKEYSKHRIKTQPVNFSSAGSIFKNPSGFFAGELGEEDKSSSSRLAAARLIEECGLKGKKVGNVKISEKHANFIVNLGNGQARDVIRLINLAKKRVKNKFGIVLEEEIQYLF